MSRKKKMMAVERPPIVKGTFVLCRGFCCICGKNLSYFIIEKDKVALTKSIFTICTNRCRNKFIHQYEKTPDGQPVIVGD